jgi:MFS family permease
LADEGFDWDSQEQGMILGAYFYGFMVLMLPGGFLAEKYGGRWVLLVSTLVGSLISLIQPIAAKEWGANYLSASRAIQGAVMVQLHFLDLIKNQSIKFFYFFKGASYSWLICYGE